MSDNTTERLNLRRLLFQHTDIYADWYFYILKRLQSPEGLTVQGQELDLSDAQLPVVRPQDSKSPSYIGIKYLKDYDITDEFLFYRRYFPAILIFPNDELSITKTSLNEVNIKLLQKGIERVLIEEEFLQFEVNKKELLTRLGNAIRNTNLDLKKVLENLEISHPPLKEMQLWAWLNEQDSFLFWEQLQDLQNMYEAYVLITSNHANFYYLSLFETCKQDMQHLMGLVSHT